MTLAAGDRLQDYGDITKLQCLAESATAFRKRVLCTSLTFTCRRADLTWMTLFLFRRDLACRRVDIELERVVHTAATHTLLPALPLDARICDI